MTGSMYPATAEMPKDAAAPGLEQAQAAGLLPTYEACLAQARSLRQ